MNSNTKIYDRAVDRSAMIRLYERRVTRKVNTVLDDHTSRLDGVIKGSNINTGKGKIDLNKSIDDELLKTYREVQTVSSRSLVDLFSDQVSYTYQGVEASMSKIWETDRPKVRLAEEIVLQQPLYKNKTLAAGWAGISAGSKIRIEALIRKGIAEGRTVDEIAYSIRKGFVHTITRAQSRALVVTSITSVAAQADHAIYNANKKAIVGYQYVAVLDDRTSEVCASRDGKIFEVDDIGHLPPAHYNCRSTTVPVFKSWEDISKLEGVAQVRRKNMEGLTKTQKAFYDGQTPMRETYNEWLARQGDDVKLRHLGEYEKVKLFNSGQLTLDKFTNPEGNSIGITELRRLTNRVAPNDSMRFAAAKQRLDAMQLGASTPDDFINDPKLTKTLKDFYILQSRDLDGELSLTNYRGNLIHTKKAAKKRVLMNPPREDQVVFNPITGRYQDSRMFQPDAGVIENAIRLVNESDVLKDTDKEYIKKFIANLDGEMSSNERSVVAENLRILFTRYRKNGEVWQNFKAVSQSQIKFDIMNISDTLETHLRRDADFLKRMKDANYLDPVLGPVQLNDLHDNFISNILAKNKWEDSVAPKVARELRGTFDAVIARHSPTIWTRLSDRELQQFYLKFANRLSMAETPDRDHLAVELGRDLHNLANYNGNRREWYELGLEILNSKNVGKFFELETFGVQKRRMKSRMSGAYFGPYYDTMSYNVRVTDPRIQKYARLTREVELGLRVSVTSDKNRLTIREGYKTYFIDRGMLGFEDSRIPITSTSSFSDFPNELVDKSLTDALNWASKTKYKIDDDYYDFTRKLLYFEDDRGAAEKYNELNEYRKYIVSRSDAYERFKTMEWLRESGKTFSNHAFVDHRARIYDRGLISPQSGETFRPFLNTAESHAMSPASFSNFQDQVGSFLGGLSDRLEGRYNSLTFTGRQKIAEKWRPELVKIGNHMLRGKPADIRAILESDIVKDIDGEDIGKFYRLAMETAKFDNYLKGNYSKASLETLKSYKTSLALEQDASSSGAQIIALTTRNKQLAELSNVIPTNYKKRLYDEIAASTYNDRRFIELNKKLGLSEKDLRKAAKAQNMVTFYGAGERTGIFNVEGKLSKALGKDVNTLVVKAADRDIVLNEISARIARYERFDVDTALELRQLRQNVKDVFNKGLSPGDEILEQLYFLQPQTRELVERMSNNYEKVVTPDDFKQIAQIMSGYLADQVPILKDFTRFFGRLASEYLANAKPSRSDFDWELVAETALRGSKKKGYVLSDRASELLGIKAGEPVSEKVLRRFGSWRPDGTLSKIINGIPEPEARRIGGKYFKTEVIVPTFDVNDLVKGKLLKQAEITGLEIFKANKLPKSWTNVPWVNFDGKIIEQNFTQVFEERIFYKNKAGEWVTNILQVPQKTSMEWWEELLNKSGKINDIADATKARTAFAVNGNHSNDAVIVKKFHLWGAKNKIPTSTIHDAFFTNSAQMLEAREALKKIYAEALEKNVVRLTLEEMRARGLPQEIYERYLEEAIESGLIPVIGKSRINGRLMKESDILKIEDILKNTPRDFKSDYGWYGVG
jgi:SPP1 gp7 family putative phage head morphogenesis protein